MPKDSRLLYIQKQLQFQVYLWKSCFSRLIFSGLKIFINDSNPKTTRNHKRIRSLMEKLVFLINIFRIHYIFKEIRNSKEIELSKLSRIKISQHYSFRNLSLESQFPSLHLLYLEICKNRILNFWVSKRPFFF